MKKYFSNKNLIIFISFFLVIISLVLLENPYLKIDYQKELYQLLFCLSILFAFLSIGLVDYLIPDNSKIILEKKIILSVLTAIIFGLLFGPKIFIKFYEYDDWVYLGFKYHKFDLIFLNETINHHYVPIYKAILYLIDYYFYPNYNINAILFLFTFIFCLICFIEIALRHISDSLLAILLVISYGVWPTAGISRYWFGGGYWLLLPIPFYLLLLVWIQYIVKNNKKLSILDNVKIFSISFSVVLTSSQIIIPAIGLIAYISAYHLIEKKYSITEIIRKYYFLLLLVLIPSALSLYMRTAQIKNYSIFHEIFNGTFFKNSYSFIKHKLMYSDVIWVLSFILILLIISEVKKRKNKLNSLNIDNISMHENIALFFFAAFSFGLYILQVGIARSWQPYAVNTPYYTSYPLICIFIMCGSVLGLIHVKPFELKIYSLKKIINTQFSIKAILIFLCCYSIFTTYFINKLKKEEYEFVSQQIEHVEKLAEATCDVLKNNSREEIALQPFLPFTSCKDCINYFNAPFSFLETISTDSIFFGILTKRFSEQYCPQDSKRLKITHEGSEFYTNGLSESKLMKEYYLKYYFENK